MVLPLPIYSGSDRVNRTVVVLQPHSLLRFQVFKCAVILHHFTLGTMLSVPCQVSLTFDNSCLLCVQGHGYHMEYATHVMEHS